MRRLACCGRMQLSFPRCNDLHGPSMDLGRKSHRPSRGIVVCQFLRDTVRQPRNHAGWRTGRQTGSRSCRFQLKGSRCDSGPSSRLDSSLVESSFAMWLASVLAEACNHPDQRCAALGLGLRDEGPASGKPRGTPRGGASPNPSSCPKEWDLRLILVMTQHQEFMSDRIFKQGDAANVNPSGKP